MSLLAASSVFFAAVIVLAMLAAGGIALFGLFLKTIQANAARDGNEGVEPLRDRVLALMNRAESLKARLADTVGAEVPLTGRAAELAAGVERDLEGVWQDWTSIHERLQAARDLQEGPGDLGGGQHLAAAELADDPDTELRARAAQQRLDLVEASVQVLEDAPVQAAAALDQVAARLAEVPDPTASDRHAELSKPPWTDPLTLLDDATELLGSIPPTALDLAPIAVPLPVEAPPDRPAQSASEAS